MLKPGLVTPVTNAANIDIGTVSHLVAVPPDRDDESVHEFR